MASKKKNHAANNKLNGKILKVISLKSGKTQGYFLSPLQLNTVIEVHY